MNAPVVFNIETIYDPDIPDILQPRLDDFDAPSTWKDEEKIDRYKREKLEEAHNKMGLSPLTGKIICFGARIVLGPNVNHEQMICSGNERDVVEFAYDALTEYRLTLEGVSVAYNPEPIVGYNSSRFDIPYLVNAMMRYEMPVPSILQRSLGRERYWQTVHVDIFKLMGEQGSLAKWAARFGLPLPYGDGSQVQEWWNAEDYTSIKRHCSSGMSVVANIYSRYEHAGLV